MKKNMATKKETGASNGLYTRCPVVLCEKKLRHRLLTILFGLELDKSHKNTSSDDPVQFRVCSCAIV